MTKTSQEHAMRLVDLPKGKHAIGTKWVYRNKKDERGIVFRNKARLVAQGYTQEEGINYDKVFDPVARIEAIRLFFAYASFMGFTVYQMDVKSTFLYGIIKEEVYVCQPSCFEDPHFPDKVKKALYGLHQALRAWYETLSTNLLENGFRRGIIDNTLFIKKDKASKPDIMFAICTCARFQVTPKVLHLHAAKRIFRYLKGQPRLGLWYPRDSPFNLEVFLDSDYAEASLDRKSTTGGCQFLGKRLISWQFNPTVYTLCPNGEAHIQAVVDKNKVIITEASIRRDLRFEDERGVDCLSNEVIFEQLTLMGTIASAIICLATNPKFNFSKYIFDNIVKHLDGEVKFMMYPRFGQVFLDNQVEERINEEDMFGVNDLDGDEMIMDVTAGENVEQSAKVVEKEVSTADPITTAVTDAGTRPKEKRIVMQEPYETPSPKPIDSSQHHHKLKAKARKKWFSLNPLKRKDQIMIDEEVARNLEAQIQGELEEEERLARFKEEETNIALIESWDNTQAMMDADYELAARLQEEERGELSIEEKSRLFVELMDKRNKHFASLKAKKIRKIKMLFNNTIKWIEAFVPMDTKLVKDSEKSTEGSEKAVEGNEKAKEGSSKRT
uniref:Putative ribonuclease H-like domain-containing protein n=1 Tax=Tanacetum cinerariifolium TaxID=118510 RepID=A0A6L2LJX7_TANCI|nr:putative ribonuclease H-like domain-containing protein [Tanacetum cinerariifolium]